MSLSFLPWLALLLPVTGYSQLLSWPPTEQQILEQATVIFEGKLVRTHAYFNADSTRLWYTSLVRRTGLLKGVPTAGLIQVVYPGPRLSGIRRDPHTGELIMSIALGPSHGPDDSQGAIPLPEGQPFVLFCRPLLNSPPSAPPLFAFTAGPLLEPLGGAWDIFRNHTIVSEVGGRFTDLPAFYRYLAERYALYRQQK